MSFVLIYYISNHCIGEKWSFLWENPFSHTASVTGSEVFCCGGVGGGVVLVCCGGICVLWCWFVVVLVCCGVGVL